VALNGVAIEGPVPIQEAGSECEVAVVMG